MDQLQQDLLWNERVESERESERERERERSHTKISDSGIRMSYISPNQLIRACLAD